MRSTTLLGRALSAAGALALVAASVLVASPATAVPASGIVFTAPSDGAILPPNQQVIITGTVTDAEASYTFSLDGSSPSPVVLQAGGTFSFGVFHGINGWHTFTVAGGGDSASVTYFLDNAGPDVQITSPVEGGAANTSLTLAYSVGDGVQSWITWDSGMEIPLTDPSPITYDVASLSPGAHQVRVRSVDSFGNSTTVTRNFVIDRTAPVVTITMPADHAWLDPAQAFTIMATSDDPGTQTWDIRVDGATVAGGPGGTPIGYGMPAPTTWVDGSTHTIAVNSIDALGNFGAYASVSVRADTKKPSVTIDTPSGVLHGGSVITGTAADAGSGIASVQVDFRKYRADETCGAVQFSATASVSGGAWSLELPPTAPSGPYCLRAVAADAVGHTRVATDQPVATVDLTGPVAPTGLAPVGELWNVPTTLTWDPVSDAVSYDYRIAATESDLDTATVGSTSTPSAAPLGDLSGSWFWQVRGVDEFGNVGTWTDPQAVTVLGAPVLDGSCALLCSMVGDELDLSWSAVPGAVGYRVSVSWRGEPGDPSDNIVERYVLGDATSATISLPDDLPSGTIVVRVRAELDHKVEGSRLGPWSERTRYLHVAHPVVPVLLTPANGAYVDGDGVQLAWSDDSAVFAWELRIATEPTLGEDGGLGGGTGAPLIDPMILLFIAGGSSGDLPRNIDLDEIDAVLDCDALYDYIGGDLGELPFACADGSFTLPDTLTDGDYFWQVRGYGIGMLASESFDVAGPWSAVGHFVVGDAPVPPVTGGGSTGRSSGGHVATGTTAGTPLPETAQPGEPGGSDDQSGSGSDGSGDSNGSDDSDGPDASEATGGTADGSGDGFPLVWIIVGAGALVVLTGAGAFIRFLVVRGR